MFVNRSAVIVRVKQPFVDQPMSLCDELDKKLTAKSAHADSFCESALATFAFGL